MHGLPGTSRHMANYGQALAQSGAVVADRIDLHVRIEVPFVPPPPSGGRFVACFFLGEFDLGIGVA